MDKYKDHSKVELPLVMLGHHSDYPHNFLIHTKYDVYATWDNDIKESPEITIIKNPHLLSEPTLNNIIEDFKEFIIFELNIFDWGD